MRVDGEVYRLKGRLIQHRRYLHKHPELEFDLYTTRDYILSCLKDCGFDEIRILAGTGIKAVMKGADGGMTLAFRADMDALPIQEETGLDFASVNCGKMHACGHDGHMAILLGLAEWLSLKRKELGGNIVLIFQPAEETVGGALPMIEEGVLENPKVDAVFGFHLLPDLPRGKIGVREGPVMAHNCEFSVDIIGRSAHGALAHLGTDALLAACHLVNAVYSLFGRWVTPDEKALLTIGRLQAGEERNIIAEKATLEGIVRTFDGQVYDRIKKNMLDLLKALEISHRVKTLYREDVYYPAVNNDAGLVSRLKEFLPGHVLEDIQPMMIAEDFSYYQQKVPGVYMFLGCGDQGKGFTAPLHSSKFNFDEEVLLYGLQVYCNIIKGFGIVR